MRNTHRRLAAGLVILLAVTFAPGTPSWAAKPAEPKQYVQDIATVPGRAAKPKPVVSKPIKQFTPPKAAWPAVATAEFDLAAGPSTRAAGAKVAVAPAAKAKGAKAAGKVRVEVLDRAKTQEAGLPLAVKVSPAAGVPAGGDVQVRIDYTSFQSAYGAGWADRLRLVQVPECAAGTSCSVRELPTKNDGKSLSAEVKLAAAGTVVALAAGASGNSGDYAATSLSPSSNWSHGGATGGFTWSYDITTPPGLGGPQPDIGLGYSSQSTDGRMVTTNNQASWFGEGFDWGPGSIERRYVPCSDDMSGEHNNTTKVYDQCWKTDNATLSLGGKSTELIYNATEKRWHGRSENGARIVRKLGAVNGDDGEAGADGDKGEHWVVTTTDGTSYYFGLNRLQGWVADKPETNSVFTAPVFGNNPGEPCRATTFGASSCNQAYRWNLDYVVDPHGNTMSYWYGKDTNKYGKAKSETDLLQYDRDGYLKRIDYGTHQRDKVGGVATDTVYTTTKAPMQVLLTPADRCFTNCSDRANFQDTPYDLECVTGKKCQSWSPSFWSTRRLQSITTKVWDPAAKDYRDVERWTLTHKFPDNGDGTPGSLWLSELAHEGLLGTTARVPNVVFTPTALDNRVDTALRNGLRPMRRPRIDTIVTETGAKLDVNYKGTECVAGATPAPETNTKRCYPVRWAPEDLGQESGTEITDWFHKYVVDNVIENDATSRPTGSPLATVTKYDYFGGAAWRYADDDGLTKADKRTWNQFRGYEVVRTTIGDAGEQSTSDSRYFRGMHGDRLNKEGGTKPARVTDSKNVATLDDLDGYAGMKRETIVYNGLSSPISGTLEWPWRGEPTATRTIGSQKVEARFLGTAETRSWTALDGGRADRWTRTVNEHDSLGQIVRTTEHGEVARSGDERCTLNDYAADGGAWLRSYLSRVRKFALTCADARTPGRVLTEADVIADVKTSFDDTAWGTAPTRGELTRIEELTGWQNNAPQHKTMKRMAFDDYGRISDMWDVADRHTGTAYTPAAGGPVTKVVNTNPADWTDTTEIDPRGNATLVTDANGRATTKRYDALGRLTDVWLPGRSTTLTPNYQHSYGISNTTASWVETKTLAADGTQVPMVEFYDALLRVRQRQYVSASGTGRVVSDTFYDSAGRAYLTWGPYHESTKAVDRTLWVPTDGSDKIDIWNRQFFDGAGRTTADVQYHRLTETWRTTTRHTGDRTTVIPPIGGTATATVTDAAGQTMERWQYPNRDLTGTVKKTTYEYDRKGKQSKIRDNAGTQWQFGWDLRGRQVLADDPDKGRVTTAYDVQDRVTTITDAQQRSMTYDYDDLLGRRTALYDGTDKVPAKQLSAWRYDEVKNSDGESISRGQQTSSSRYVGGAAGTAYSKATTAVDSAGRPTKTSVTVPASETGLAGTYEYQSTYRADGSPGTNRLPAIGGSGGLAAETLTMGYQATGRPTTLGTTLGSGYVVSTGYTAFGEVGLTTLRNNGGKVLQVGNYYDDKTRRLNRIWTTREVNPASVSDLYYDYDAAGNITSAAETSTTAGAERQCFAYDDLRRLTEAWTPDAADCKAAPTAATTLSGPAPYWTSWSFDPAGNRASQVEHRTAAGERTTTYTHPQPTAPRPHAVTGTSTTDDAGTRTAAWEYDASGSTKTRPSAAGAQTLTWNMEGRLESSTDGSGITTYVYDADGERLIRKDPNGNTLYLPGQELRVGKSGARIGCTRYYQHGGRAVAMRTLSGVTWLGGDHQGTSRVAIDATTQSFSVRRQDPYGNQRGAPTGAAWPAAMDKGLVGGTLDNSGLTHLGAREYDPLIGRFISVDPIVDFNDPVQIQGYAYANHSPVTSSDPTGLMPIDDVDGPGTSSGGRDPQSGKRNNPHASDAEERRAESNSAETQRIRQIRKRQIMDGKFGIRQRLQDRADAASDFAEGLGERPKGKAKAANEVTETWLENKMVEDSIDKALELIDEGRHDNKNSNKKTGGELVAFDDDEFIIAFDLAFRGHTVESRDETLKTVGNPDNEVFDAYVDDVRSEFKTTNTNKPDTIRKNNFSKANDQHATRLYLQTGEDVEASTVNRARGAFHAGKRDVTTLTHVEVSGEVQAPLNEISKDLNCEGWDWWIGC